jgi:glutamate synthase (NADPH/NADH) large chain
MTGGVVAVLGETGKNFAAGMSGGVAYVLDEAGDFAERTNTGMVTIDADLDEKDESMLRRLVENHVAYTDSERGHEVLENWESFVGQFVKVMPDAYADVIADRAREDVRTSPPRSAAVATDGGPAESDAD